MAQQQKLQFIIDAQNKASEVLDEVRGKLDVLGGGIEKFAKIGAVAFAAVGTAAVAFGVSSVKAFAESEREMAKFDASLDSMIGTTQKFSTGMTSTVKSLKYTGLEAEELQIKIRALQKAIGDGKATEANVFMLKKLQAQLAETETSSVALTKSISFSKEAIEKAKKSILDAASATRKLGFGDEMAANAMAMFYQRTGDVNQAIKLNTVAMDLARAKNIELSEAAKMVNMVLSGNGKALKEYGIELDDTKSPLQAIGELHTKVKGQAEAFANTIEGRMMRLDETFGDLKEKIGGVFAPVVVKALEGITTILEKVEALDFQGMFDRWTAAAYSFFQAFDQQFHIIESFEEIWGTVVDFFETYLRPSWEGFLQTLYENKDVLLEILANFAKFLAVITAGAFIAAMGVLVTLFETLGVAVKGVKWFVESLSEAFLDLATVVDSVFDKLSRLANKFGLGGLSSGLKNAGASISGFFGGARATGGPVSPGKSYLVGEHGPEMFTPNSYGSITNARSTAAGSGIIVNINGNTFMGKEGIAQQIGDEIVRALGLRMKLS